jgi:uncharacterized protein YkwD
MQVCSRRSRTFRSTATVLAAVLTLAACNGDDGPDAGADEPTVTGPDVADPTGTEPDSTDPDSTDPDSTDPHSVAPTDARTPEEQIAVDLFERANDERRERGLDSLEWNEELAQLAREWSAEMSDTGEFRHRDIDLDLIQDMDGLTGLGENIFTSTAPVPAGRAHEGWMRSPGHRANLLSPDWDLLGVGVVCAEDGSVYATQNFGRTATGPPGAAQDPPPEEPIARAEFDGPSC